MEHRLEIINARLPLADERLWYTLRAVNGTWTHVEAQESYLPAGAGTPHLTLDGYGADRSSMQDAPVTGGSCMLDAEGKLVLPGFVDAHMHLDKAFSLRQVGNRSGTLAEAIGNYSEMAPHFTKAEIYARMAKTALLAIGYGTTAIRTHIDFHAAAGRQVALQSIEAALELKQKLASQLELQIFPMVPYRSAGADVLELIDEAVAMGVTGIGGAPHLADDPDRNIDLLFKLADRYGCPIDLHTDESDDPRKKTALTVAQKTIDYGFRGRATVGHLCSLASMEPKEADAVIARIAEAGLNAVTLPAANLYLQGRGMTKPPAEG
nr:amidohydrolase family protein [Paenibacillus protaetiae]